MKFGKWRVEYTGTLLALFAIGLMVMPTSLKTTVQANHITKWQDVYNKLNYALDAIFKQEQSKILTNFSRAKTSQDREYIVLQLIKPYFRLNDRKIPTGYKVKYKNKTTIKKDDLYYVKDYYFTDNGMIVGIKDIPPTDDGENSFIMTFDVNGLRKPNRWGKDVFGVKVSGYTAEAIGKNYPVDKQYENCSNKGSGTLCSNYYLIGGNFED